METMEHSLQGATDIHVSVIISTHNRSASLPALLTCLEKQSLPKTSYEVVLVDDGSTDGTAQLLADYCRTAPLNITVVTAEEEGAPGARNTGVAHAKGTIIAFTDDDCLPCEDWLEHGLPYFSTDSVVGVEGAIAPSASIAPPPSQYDHTPAILSRPSVVMGRTANMFYRRAVLDAIGGFDPCFVMPFGPKRSCREDTDLAWRALQHGDIPFAADALVLHPPRYVSAVQRIRLCKYKMLDVLLLKKHPGRFRQVLGFTFQAHYLSLFSLVWFGYGLLYFSLKQ